MLVTGDTRHGLREAKPPACRLTSTLKHTGQEPGGQLCQIFKCSSFLQSKSANNLCKLLQHLGDVPQTPGVPPVGSRREAPVGTRYWGIAPGSHRGTPGLQPPNENSCRCHCWRRETKYLRQSVGWRWRRSVTSS